MSAAHRVLAGITVPQQLLIASAVTYGVVFALLEAPRKMKERHLSLMVKQDGRTFRAVAWRAAEREPFLLAHRQSFELAYSLEQGEYRGEKTTELTVADMRAPVLVPA